MPARYDNWLALERALTEPVNAPVARANVSGWASDILFPGNAVVNAGFLLRNIKNLNADIEALRNAINGRLTKGGSDVGPLIQFASFTYSEFYGRWQGFYLSHQGVTDNLGDTADEFARFRAEYLALRSQWVDQFGQKAPETPGGLSWWTITAGVTAVALVLLVPAVAPVVASMIARKAAAKAALAVV